MGETERGVPEREREKDRVRERREKERKRAITHALQTLQNTPLQTGEKSRERQRG